MNVLIKKQLITIFENEKVNRFVWWLILLALSLLYFGMYWNRTFPYTEGWGINYAELISAGKVPYRDFYYYLPPLNLLSDWLIWKVSFGYLLLYRAWRWAERLIIETLLYKILLKITSNPAHACIATFLGAVLSAANVYELLGDYNQTTELIVLIAVSVLIRYVGVFNKDEKREKKLLFCFGIVIGAAFLLKQTIFFSLSLLFFCTLTYFFVVHKKKQYLRSVVMVICGAVLPILIACIYLLFNEALGAYVRQVYLDVDSKGDFSNILLAFPRIILNYKTVILAVAVSMSFVCLAWLQRQAYTIKNKLIVSVFIVVNLLSNCFLMYYNEITSFKRTAFGVDLIYMSLICLACVIVCIFKETFTRRFRYGIIILSLIMLIVFVFMHKDLAYHLYVDTPIFNLLIDLSILLSALGVVVYGIWIYQYKNAPNATAGIHLIIVTGALSSVVAISMAGTDHIGTLAMRILAPYLSVYALSVKTYGERMKKATAVIILFTICAIGVSQKVTCAYSWWGWEDEIISNDSNYSIDVNGLEGFRVSQNVKNMYEEICHVVEDNTDTSSVIYGFPHIKIFNILCDNYNMNSFVPVPFYDVCSDNYAKDEAKLLKKSPPDIVIWCDLPSCMEVHEALFRGGDALGQRDIQKWFSEEVAREEYTLIAQYDHLFVYKKVSDSPIGYTYFKSDKVFNSTLNSAEALGIVSDFFEGKGTEEEPFLINTEEEFDKFRFLVNSGCQFDNCFFRQEKNLYFDSNEICSSIGKFSDGTCFKGCYDGGNHAISGLNIQEKSDSGIFGVLGGTVRNLTVKNSVIKGNTGAGIAAHALSPSAAIINCTVEKDVEVYGERAGGIVDDFSGGVINCKSEAKTYTTSRYSGKIYGLQVGYMVKCGEN